MVRIDWHSRLSDYHGQKLYKDIIADALEWNITMEEHLVAERIETLYGHLKKKPGIRDTKPPHKVVGIPGIDIDPNALEQFYTALSIAPVSRAALMADAHHGYSLPIGGVVEYNGAVFPGGVGYDIGCQVNLSILDMPVDFMEKNRESLMKIMVEHSYLGLGATRTAEQRADHVIMDDPRWDDFTPYNLNIAQHQLGTLGSGNHFVDLMVVRHRTNPDDPAVGLLTHGGSRKTGHTIAGKYMKLAEKATRDKYLKVPKGYGWLDINTDLGEEYYNMMELMVGYACANHQIVHEEIIAAMGTDTTGVLTSIHNFAVEEAPGFFMHRKGATPLGKGKMGLIPGSSGSLSYIVQGLGNEECLNSSSHGAGRRFSRSQAKKLFKQDEFDITMSDIKYHGVAHDEGITAYKDINRVIELQVEAKILEPLAAMEPRIVVMGGHNVR